jgi:hypothetical protein
MWLRCLSLGLETAERKGFSRLGPHFRHSTREQTRQAEGRMPLTARAHGLIVSEAGTTDTSAQELCDFSGTRPSLAAILPNSGSERAFIFRIAWLRWTFTVGSLIPISLAICLLRRPRAT